MFKYLFSRFSFHIPPFLREVLSENGVGSYARFGSFSIVVAAIFWTTYLVIKNHALPNMGDISLFISTGVGVHYGTSQVKNVASAITGNAPNTPNMTQQQQPSVVNGGPNVAPTNQ